MNEKFFKNYISTHFSFNTNISDLRRKLEYRVYDLNTKLDKADKNSKVLEIGFGTGVFLEYLNFKGFKNVEGLEISQECYEYTKKLTDYKLFLENDTSSFAKTKKNYYDYIVLFDVLEHINKSYLLEYLQDLKSMLKEEGKILIRVPNSANPFNQLYWNDITHEFFYNAISLHQVLRLSGFNSVKISGWREEDILIKSKITNFTSFILTPILRLMLGLLRTGQFPNIPFSRNLFAEASLLSEK
jgi:2-polyprenyl-3-methyl-5-hydroxy-6-metoxy-1,4-benzoquinol methylase